MDENYQTITRAEYVNMRAVILLLRDKLQRARQALELNAVSEALEILRKADDDKGIT
jgi:hypothetical protein